MFEQSIHHSASAFRRRSFNAILLMPIYRRCGRCGARILSGTTCPCMKDANRERYRIYDKTQRDAKSKQFYNSAAWLRERRHVIEDLDDGMDVYAYVVHGRIVPADTVHHIIPLRDDWKLRLSDHNLMSVSSASHAEIEALYKQSKQAAVAMLQKIVRTHRQALGTW